MKYGGHHDRTNGRHLYNSERQVMEMECRLLFSKFNNEATAARVQEEITGNPGNRLAHHAGAFKLGLRTALDLKEGNPQAGVTDGVMLRCRDPGCSGYKERMSYSFAGPELLCPRCQKFYMQCIGCGEWRKGLFHSCCSCGNKFI